MGALCCIDEPHQPTTHTASHSTYWAAGGLSLWWHTIYYCSSGWLFLPLQGRGDKIRRDRMVSYRQSCLTRVHFIPLSNPSVCLAFIFEIRKARHTSVSRTFTQYDFTQKEEEWKFLIPDFVPVNMDSILGWHQQLNQLSSVQVLAEMICQMALNNAGHSSTSWASNSSQTTMSAQQSFSSSSLFP